MRTLAALLLLAATSSISAQTYERVLLPLAFRGEIAGAFGTRWTATNVLFNDGKEPLQFVLGDSTETLGPRAFTNIAPDPHPSLATFVYVSNPESAAFTSFFGEQSRSAENSGTETPVARNADFRNRIVLPMLLLRGPFRTTLRVYGSDELPGDVRVRLYRLDRVEPFVDEVVHLSGSVSVPPSQHPAYVMLADLVVRWPVLEAAASVRVELDALSPQQRIWAFASQTNNSTQLVTTVHPQ